MDKPKNHGIHWPTFEEQKAKEIHDIRFQRIATVCFDLFLGWVDEFITDVLKSELSKLDNNQKTLLTRHISSVRPIRVPPYNHSEIRRAFLEKVQSSSLLPYIPSNLLE